MTTYTATDYTSPSIGHGVWLGTNPLSGLTPSGTGGSSSQYFSLSNGVFTELDDGTASLTGSLVNNGNSDLTFDISLTLTVPKDLDETGGPSTGEPKLGNGSGDPTTWDYYMMWEGTLTGTGNLAGVIDVEGVSGKPFFQVGDGANDKDSDFGASGWMDYESTGITRTLGSGHTLQTGAFSTFNSGSHGDVNIDLEFKSRTTVPDAGGTAALLGLSILGMAIAKRGKRRS